MKKQTKLYNVIFPIWFLMYLFPPVIFLTLAGNFLIDSLVILISFFAFKLSKKGLLLKSFYKKTIVKVWLFGFLADIIGAVLLLTAGELFSSKLSAAIAYNPYKNATATLIIILATVISGFFIFLFNYKYSFRNQIAEKGLRIKVALSVAIITIPWTFLLPTHLFY